MDIHLEKIRIIQQIAEVNEEWVILGLKRLLGMDESVTPHNKIDEHRSKLKPMTKEELIQRALKAEEDIKAGRVVDIETYFASIQK